MSEGIHWSPVETHKESEGAPNIERSESPHFGGGVGVGVPLLLYFPGENGESFSNPNPHIEGKNMNKNTIRNARITILIPLEYFDVMDMKSLQKIIPPEFSDVMIAYVVGGEGKRCKPDKLREIIRPVFF